MAIISTIAPEAITNVHNDGARALRGFLSFAEAQSNGAHDHARAVLTSFNPDAATTFGAELPPDPVRHAIAKALRGRGHIVHEHVGGASFRCDLAIVDAVGDCYALGVLLDRDANEAGAIEERFVFRPSILRAFGWRVMDIPVAAWLRAREATIERIESELARSSWELADADPFSGVALPPKAPPAAQPTGPSALVAQPDLIPGGSLTPPVQAPPTEPSRPPQASVETKLTEFRFIEGSSSKFWRVGVNDCDLIVEFGRIGTKGQRVVKTFDDQERAKRESVKLTLEKTRKGYQEVG